MKDWYQNLEVREQLFVGIGGVVVVLVILWAVIWAPLDKGHRDMQASVQSWQRSLSELRIIGATATATTTSSQPSVQGSNESPVIVVDRTLRERQLASTVKRQQPTPNGIRVEFENVAFDQLVLPLIHERPARGARAEIGHGQVGLQSCDRPVKLLVVLAEDRPVAGQQPVDVAFPNSLK